MFRRLSMLLPALLLLSPAATTRAWAQATLPPNFEDRLVVSGLSSPTGMAFLPDGRCLVTEQFSGRIRLIVNGVLAAIDPVCTIPNVWNNNWARGLYGIAVDPRWPASPYVYAHYAAISGKVMLSRFTATGDLGFTGNGAITIDPASRYDLFGDIRDGAHNGGTLRFGADQMLYASVGDSISISCSAQRLGNLRGVILRLEVRNLPSGPGGPPAKALLAPPDNPFAGNPDLNGRLVWAHGLRNPFRFHIDPADGAVFVADVGEADWEEIDRLPAGGANLGWPLYEGPAAFSSCPGVSGAGLTAPIYAYGNGAPQCVIGGGVYRRPANGANAFPPEYDGDYFLSDLYTGVMRRLKGSGTSWGLAPAVAGQPDSIAWGTGLGEVTDYLVASDGSLWYCRQAIDAAENTGQIRRIVYTGFVGVAGAPPPGLAFTAAYPLPARDGVTLEYRLPSPDRVELEILDLGGRRVRMLEPRGERAAGTRRVHWDARDDRGHAAANGLYFARLRVGRWEMVRRVSLCR